MAQADAPSAATGGGRPLLSAEPRLLAISAASIALYILTWRLEDSIFHNRLPAPLSLSDPANAGTRWLLLWQMLLYVVLTVLLFAVYLAVLRMGRRGQLDDARVRRWALGVPVILNILCLAWVPLLSQDVYSYLAHGYLGVLPGHNPFLEPIEVVRELDLGPRLIAVGWHISPDVTPYGVLWTRLEMSVATLCGDNVFAAALCFKVIALLASLGSAWLIWRILGRTCPALQLQGSLAYLWNPLVIMEFAGEGHNDALMIFLSIGALAACVACRPTVSVIAQLLGFLTKYTCLLFFPAQLIYLWRTRRSAARLAAAVAVGFLGVIIVAVILYVPLWAGVQTFGGILTRADTVSSATLSGISGWLLKHSPLKAAAGTLTTAVLTLPVLAFAAWASLRVHSAADLARTCAWISLAYLLVASPDYWPWYACIPVAWIAVGEPGRLLWLALLLSFTARLVAPLELLHVHDFLSWHVSKGIITALGSLVPLLALTVWAWRERQRRSAASLAAA